MKKMEKRDLDLWPIALVFAIFVAICCFKVYKDSSDKKMATQESLRVDSIARVEAREDSIKLAERQEQQTQQAIRSGLRQAYLKGLNKGYELGRSSCDEACDEALLKIKKELVAINDQLRESNLRDSLGSIQATEHGNYVESIPDTAVNFIEGIQVPDSSSEFEYSKKLYLGFTSDIGLNITGGNGIGSNSWNYFVLSYENQYLWDKESYSLSYGYSGKQSQLRLMLCTYWSKSFRTYTASKLIWGNPDPTTLTFLVGAEKKLGYSPISIYGEGGYKFLDGATPYMGLGVRLNFQKEFWRIK